MLSLIFQSHGFLLVFVPIFSLFGLGSEIMGKLSHFLPNCHNPFLCYLCLFLLQYLHVALSSFH